MVKLVIPMTSINTSSESKVGLAKAFAAEGGFTLAELVFVALILTVLAVIAVLTVSGVQEQTTADLVRVDQKMIRSAARTYYLEKNVLPDDIQTLVDGGYLDANPDDKFLDGSGAKYALTPSGNSWTLRSVGPDRKAGTPDDLVLTFSF